MNLLKPLKLLTNPEHAVRVHAISFGVWVLMTIPSVLFWSDSVLWVIFLSLYAIWVTHLSSMQGALADRRVKRDNDDDDTED